MRIDHAIGLSLIGLKLGRVIDWSWVWVLFPILWQVYFFILVLLFFLIAVSYEHFTERRRKQRERI
jgi:uncharacterized membrane protein